MSSDLAARLRDVLSDETHMTNTELADWLDAYCARLNVPKYARPVISEASKRLRSVGDGR